MVNYYFKANLTTFNPISIPKPVASELFINLSFLKYSTNILAKENGS